MAAGSWVGLFTGTRVEDPHELDVDHMVPLKNAHDSGGWAWSLERKRAYANDLGNPGHLIAVTAGANRAKGARGPDEWRPPAESDWCEYATDWVHIKDTWELTATAEEWAALEAMLDTCAEPPTVTTTTASPRPAGAPTATATPKGGLLYDPQGPDRDCGDFPAWQDAQDFFEAAGGPQRDRHRLDGNNDAIACESLPGAPQQ